MSCGLRIVAIHYVTGYIYVIQVIDTLYVTGYVMLLVMSTYVTGLGGCVEDHFFFP